MEATNPHGEWRLKLFSFKIIPNLKHHVILLTWQNNIADCSNLPKLNILENAKETNFRYELMYHFSN